MARMLVRVVGEWTLVITGYWLMSDLGAAIADGVEVADRSAGGTGSGGLAAVLSFVVATALVLYVTALAAAHTAALHDALRAGRKRRIALPD